MPEYLIKGEMTTLVRLYVTGIVSKAQAELTTMSKGAHVSSGCARHRPVYQCWALSSRGQYRPVFSKNMFSVNVMTP